MDSKSALCLEKTMRADKSLGLKKRAIHPMFQRDVNNGSEGGKSLGHRRQRSLHFHGQQTDRAALKDEAFVESN